MNSKIFEKPSCKLKFLAREGFNTPNFFSIDSTESLMVQYQRYIDGFRDTLDYDIDGLVEEVDDWDIQQSLGYEPNGLNPKFATAIKFDSVAKSTKLLDIEWSAGSTGRIVPVAVLYPVEIMGVTISKATLHNAEFVKSLIDNGLKMNGDVIIARANDVIPKVLGVKHQKDSQDMVAIELPTNCPTCNTELSRTKADLVCENLSCKSKVIGLFMNFLNTLDIKGVSEKFVEKAVEVYDIKSLDDVLTLSEEQIKSLPGFADKSASLTYNAIHSVKRISPEQFFALLNIPNNGVRMFETVLKSVPLDKLLDMTVTVEELIDTKGIAEKTASVIYEGLQNNLNTIQQLKKHFDIVIAKKGTTLSGKSFCITGKLSRRRADIEKDIKNAGGIIASVSQKLDFLVTNEADSSSTKMQEVEKINAQMSNKICIISESELEILLNGVDDA